MGDEIKDLMIKKIEDWLGQKGVTLWYNWDVSDPKERRLAAEAFLKELNDINDYTKGFTQW